MELQMNKSLIYAALATAFTLNATAVQANPFASLFGKTTGQEADPAVVATEAAALSDRHAPWARPLLHALYRDGEWGAVLNLNRLGLAAMEQREFGLAAKAFDQAIARVESIYADDPSAAKARSVFNAETVKDFKGEPYERAMLYYYRGLLYLQDGDYQNARAAFLAADRHDTLSSAEDKSFAGDFGLMKYMAGWASQCDGDTARASQLLEEARSADASIAALPERLGKSIVLIDAGAAPVKWGDGQHKHVLKFKAGSSDDDAVSLVKAGAAVGSLKVVGDVTYQATTRGGREVDGIMAGKAAFKDTAGAVGTSALSFGQQMMSVASVNGDRGSANLGLAGMVVGLIAKGVESAATPGADVRAWDTLPARILMHSGTDAATPKLVTSGKTMALPLQATHGACSFAWGRTRSAVPTQLTETGPSQARPSEASRGDRNRAFRMMLSNELLASN
jgi:tetratricopeptide (TPR) repeat protein